MKKKIQSLISLFVTLIVLATAFSLQGVKVEAATSGQAVVECAKKYLGVPYVWGGTTPSGFDCSGLVQYVYKEAAGINLSRTTYDQVNEGRAVSADQLQPGDLVFPHEGHVQIYVGNGQIIHAPHTGDVVRIAPIGKVWRARRILPDAPQLTEKDRAVFNAEYYAAKYVDLKNTFGTDEGALFNHFTTIGVKEGRGSSPAFEVGYYLNTNPDVKAAVGDGNYEGAYNHFMTSGYKEGRSLSPVFNLGYYIKNNPDLVNAYGDNYFGIMNHFIACGMSEGRLSSENFNLIKYKSNYEDLRSVFGNDNKQYYLHYLGTGQSEGRVANEFILDATNVVFDAHFYADKYQDLKNAFGYDEGQLKNHFFNIGMKEGRCASPIFDVSYYLNTNADVKAVYGDGNYEGAYDHFKKCGYKEDRDSSPVFNLTYYKEHNSDVANAYGEDNSGIIRHFLSCGMDEGRQGSKNFSVEKYKANYEDLRNTFGDDNRSYYVHYLNCGFSEGRVAR